MAKSLETELVSEIRKSLGLPEKSEVNESYVTQAKKYNLPIVIHSRKSYDEIFEVLESEGTDKPTARRRCRDTANSRTRILLQDLVIPKFLCFIPRH